MTIGSEAFCKPLKVTPISMANGETYNFSARFLEADLHQPVITHYDLDESFGAIRNNQEGMLLLEAKSIGVDPITVAHALFGKYGSSLLLAEIHTRVVRNSPEFDKIFWRAAERLTALHPAFTDDTEMANILFAPSVKISPKKTGIVETLLSEYVARQQDKAKLQR